MGDTEVGMEPGEYPVPRVKTHFPLPALLSEHLPNALSLPGPGGSRMTLLVRDVGWR